MPLYEYECTACHRRTEKIQKFSDPELTVCPGCNGPLERTITAPNVQFKGGGWYKDLYSSAKPAAPAAGDSAPGGADSSSETKAPSTGETSSSSDTKPASAPTPAAAPAPAPAASTSASSTSTG